MNWSRVALAASLTLAVVLVLPAPASAQIHQCGPFQIVFRNPDLQPGTDGFITAEGQFFAQFQVIGAGADKVTIMGFSFGAYTADFQESQVCPAGAPSEAWYTGQQIPNYRADVDAADGFFINLQTPLVPDGQYTAAIHAYDANNKELARFWAKAVVDNCDAPGPAPPARCDTDTAQHQRQDKTGPWPMVLPGDGQKLPAGTDGFSIEFAEELSSHAVFLNGMNITSELEEWQGRLWDDDLIPGYGPNGLGALLVPECSRSPPQECAYLGVAYRWNNRSLTNADFVRVEATDLAGNSIVKSIHIGSSVAGGAITDDVPLLTHTVDVREIALARGQSATFQFSITNQGGGTGHPFATSEGPEGWTLEWQPAHVVVEPGQTQSQALVVTPATKAQPGTYAVNATLTYQQGGVEQVISQPLTVTLTGASIPSGNETDNPGGGGKKSPGASPVLVASAVVAAAFLLRRRRAA